MSCELVNGPTGAVGGYVGVPTLVLYSENLLSDPAGTHLMRRRQAGKQPANVKVVSGQGQARQSSPMMTHQGRCQRVDTNGNNTKEL